MQKKPQIGKTYILTDCTEFTPVSMERQKLKSTTVHDYSMQYNRTERVYVDAAGKRVKKSRFVKLKE